jgi:N,N'-diacetyllegionaminate synthase
VKIGDFDLEKKVMVVAEIGNNHEGMFDTALQMIKAAARTGAHAVKFQTIRAERLVRREDRARFETLKSFELSDRQFEKLAAAAADEGVIFLSTPFDPESAEFLIDRVASFGKPVILSTGLLRLSEAAAVKSRIEKIWESMGVKQELAALHCVCSYPAPPEEANLGAISAMKKEFGCTVGYSDHVMGIEAAVAAAVLGARIIEKHFTLDKNYSAYRDHQLSADPADMALLVRRVSEIELMMGNGEKAPRGCEKNIEEAVRRSIAAARDLEAGHELRNGDICWLRPAGGLPPGEEKKVLGGKLKMDVRAGEFITGESVE